MVRGLFPFSSPVKQALWSSLVIAIFFITACTQHPHAKPHGSVTIAPPSSIPANPVNLPAIHPKIISLPTPPEKLAGFAVNMPNYNTEQGLALSSVRGSCRDRYGNLWFGTQGGGVSRFDGKSFQNYTVREGLANNSVLCIAEDQRGDVWFGTAGGGVSRFDGRSFTNYTTSEGLINNSAWIRELSMAWAWG